MEVHSQHQSSIPALAAEETPFTGPLPMTVIVLTFNEERTIERTLASVVPWAGEIFVVDSGSTDRTVEIASRYTDQIVVHEFVNYAKQRNWAQNNLPIRYEWILHLDAGEQVSPELAESIRDRFAMGVTQYDGFLLNRREIFLGRWIKYGGIYPTYHARLFRRGKGFCEDRAYDQHFKVSGQLAQLSGDLFDEITSDLRSWTLRHERWAELEVEEHFRQVALKEPADGLVKPRLLGSPIERRRWLRQKLYAGTPLFARPFIYFFIRYFVLLGFLDGMPGLIFHVLQGFWYRFYVDAKIWEATHRRT